jgi:hypothetical protein
LVFSTAIVEFNKKTAIKKAIQISYDQLFDTEFDIIVFPAEDYLAGKKPKK